MDNYRLENMFYQSRDIDEKISIAKRIVNNDVRSGFYTFDKDVRFSIERYKVKKTHLFGHCLEENQQGDIIYLNVYKVLDIEYPNKNHPLHYIMRWARRHKLPISSHSTKPEVVKALIKEREKGPPKKMLTSFPLGKLDEESNFIPLNYDIYFKHVSRIENFYRENSEGFMSGDIEKSYAESSMYRDSCHDYENKKPFFNLMEYGLFKQDDDEDTISNSEEFLELGDRGVEIYHSRHKEIGTPEEPVFYDYQIPWTTKKDLFQNIKSLFDVWYSMNADDYDTSLINPFYIPFFTTEYGKY